MQGAKIKKIVPFAQAYGGNHYESSLATVLREEGYDYEEILLSPQGAGKLTKFVHWIWNSFKVASNMAKDQCCIMPFEACLFLGRESRNIVIVHHVDAAFSPFYTHIINFLCYHALLLQRDRVDTLVVVSKYWKDFFIARGFEDNRIKVIYNFIDLPDLGSEDRQGFLSRLNLPNKPYFYVGNHHPKKGYRVVASELKSLSQDVGLFTSGAYAATAEEDQRLKNLELSYEDYLRLILHSEAVITYSLFKEGWCRTAHEALLLGKEVIGSGAGGMEELLRLVGLKGVTRDQIHGETERILRKGKQSFTATELAKLATFSEFKTRWLKILK